MGCLVKANALVLRNIALSLSSQLIVLVFTNSHLQRDIQQIFFRQYFCELLEICSRASKYVPKSLRNFTKIRLWRKSCRLLQEQPPDAFCKKGVPRKVFAKFIGKGLCQRLYFNKVAFLRL